MRNRMNLRKQDLFAGLFVLLYGMGSFLFLERFPFIHSDECWLAGLSGDMLAARSLGVTESFFNAKERVPHAIRALFHLLQQGMILLFGYSPGAVRLLSLLTGCLFLWILFLAGRRFFRSRETALLVTALVAADVWFIYLSHFARQEVCLLLLMAAAFFLLAGEEEDSSARCKRAAFAAVLTGLAIGFHPNSLLVAAVCTAVLLTDIRRDRRPFLLYTAIVSGFALAFVLLSYSFGPHFLKNYFAYGAADFGLDAAPPQRLKDYGAFFSRLWNRMSGTYYLPESRPALLFFAGLGAGMLVYAIRKRDRRIARVFAGLAGLFAGVFLIGRYNQLTILFFLFFGYLLLGLALGRLPKNHRRAAAGVLFAASLFLSTSQILPWLSGPTYQTYEEEIGRLIPAGEKTVGNLNAGFCFAQGALLDYRNLPYVVAGPDGKPAEEAERITRLSAYMKENDVAYVLYSTELDYLYAHRPYFNVIYGNTSFVPALKMFCETQCDEIGSFTDLRYGARVIGVMGEEAHSRVIAYRIRR